MSDLRDRVTEPQALIDRFGRRVTYLRISVTDRCDFRCARRTLTQPLGSRPEIC